MAIRACLIVLGLWAGLAQAEDKTESDARRLEQRLHAPCCRTQLLDGHESDPARGLRQEIRARLSAGETSAAIEADLVRRYGETIVSIPADRDPRGGLSALLIAIMTAAALGLVFLGARWVRRSRGLQSAAPTPTPSLDHELDAKLDHELRRLE